MISFNTHNLSQPSQPPLPQLLPLRPSPFQLRQNVETSRKSQHSRPISPQHSTPYVGSAARTATHDVYPPDTTMQQQLLNLLQQQINLNSNRQRTSTATTKLPKCTITPFRGEYRDWIRFWNQFSAEIDETNLAEISKFNYLMEFVKGKPRDDIEGLPHSAEGYIEAKEILQRKYGRDNKVKRAVLKELEELVPIGHGTSNRLERCHQFFNQLSKQYVH